MKLSIVVSYAFTACLALARSHAHSRPNGTLPKPTHRLTRHFNADILASNKDWKAASCRGDRLVELMPSSDKAAGPKIESTKGNNPPSAQSEWQGDLKQELKTWGWHEEYVGDVYADMDYLDVTSVVEALGMNGKSQRAGGNNIPYGFLKSPASAAKHLWNQKPTGDELPKLQRLSDIFWGYWVRDNPAVANICYFWMVDIANEDTAKIMARALSEAGKTISKWPGVTFNMDSDAEKAILGSANGAVFAWFLIRHKAQLGERWIPMVTLFLNDLGRSWSAAHLLFYVEVAPDREK
ncbi:uncharacterized protein CC84DRAFT_1216020 [Paraphaeosphaeria sporulosa]|uniref:Uncharacterized protein n=1 Tax=Paraphaeosphaeria sporulosa TaxID=1460663 RepID=A0A177CJK3_9PLEO|nr:uncharacterized protein CC84DRAFT_1216020 [Paraphaeosphaeria sporulosa]OAG07010.1 hypothetical protein CC84DRAFT_1216020 [Paraphaeosphaeria sporulosa]